MNERQNWNRWVWLRRNWNRWHTWLLLSGLSVVAPFLLLVLCLLIESAGITQNASFIPTAQHLEWNVADYALFAYMSTAVFAVYVTLPLQVVALVVFLASRVQQLVARARAASVSNS